MTTVAIGDLIKQLVDLNSNSPVSRAQTPDDNEPKTSLENNVDLLNKVVVAITNELSLSNKSINSISARQQEWVPFLHEEIWNLKRQLFHSNKEYNKSCFNGQFSKQEIWAGIVSGVNLEAIVETGSYLGATTEFFARTDLPVYSIEISDEFFGIASHRVGHFPNVHLIKGSSDTALCELLTETFEYQRALFYLDAHWYDHLPLREELITIFERRQSDVVMIDDFQVPYDPGYGFDRYGEKELTLTYIADIVHKYKLRAFFPAMKAEHDHSLIDIIGPRGTLVVSCDPEICDFLASQSSLQEYNT